MEYLKITGETKLDGTVEISGAKNAALPLIAATILAKNEIKICNMPDVAVSGTNGKTTVVTLIDEMCRRSGVRSVAAGNVGAPLIDWVSFATKPPGLPADLSRNRVFILPSKLPAERPAASVTRLGIDQRTN